MPAPSEVSSPLHDRPRDYGRALEKKNAASHHGLVAARITWRGLASPSGRFEMLHAGFAELPSSRATQRKTAGPGDGRPFAFARHLAGGAGDDSCAWSATTLAQPAWAPPTTRFRTNRAKPEPWIGDSKDPGTRVEMRESRGRRRPWFRRGASGNFLPLVDADLARGKPPLLLLFCAQRSPSCPTACVDARKRIRVPLRFRYDQYDQSLSLARSPPTSFRPRSAVIPAHALTKQ